MFFLRKSEKKIEEIFEVKDLFVGVLGFVTSKSLGHWHIEQVDKVILFKKEKFDDYDYCAKNIFTNQSYFFFHGNTHEFNILDKTVNGYAIFRSIPLEHFITEPKMKVSRNELLELYYKLNKSSLKENESKMEEQVQDNILKMILQTSDIVKESDIDLNLKQEIIQELDMLGKYYVDSMISFLNINDNELSLEVESEYSIGMECIKKLIEIESKFRDTKVLKSYSLKKQFGQFRKRLNQENEK